MTNLLQQALDALTRLSFLGNGDFPGNSEGNRIAQKAVSDIKQALAQQEQPAQEASATWTEMVVANLVREGVNKHRARELAAHFLTLPTQPALSDEQIMDIVRDKPFDSAIGFARAIEAHCRGGADK